MCKCEIIPTTLTTKMGPLIIRVPLVLRTRKIPQTQWNSDTQWSHFCSQGCWNDFAFTHWNEFINLHPRLEPLETPIDVEVETRTDWRGQPYKQKIIKEVDNNTNP